MNYLKPQDVTVFPFGKNRASDSRSRVLNEQNITNLVRMLTDNHSYVLSWDSDSNEIEFVLYGYYFKANLSEVIKDNVNNDIYAYIILNDTDDYSYLVGGDIITTTPSGRGTVEQPYVLTDGRFETTLKKNNGISSDVYLEYTYKTEGTVTVYDDQNIEIQPTVTDGSISTGNNKIDIKGKEGATLKLIVSLSTDENVNEGNLVIDVIHSSIFTGVSFSFSPEEILEANYSLHLLTRTNTTDKFIPPLASLHRIDPESINITNIYCGSADELID